MKEANIENIKEVEALIDFKDLPEEIKNSEILNKIAVEIYNGWTWSVWISRINETIVFISWILDGYAKMYWKSKLEALEIIAKARNVNYTNWFQNANLPKVENVHVYKNAEDFFEKHPEKKYICPSCWGASSNAYTCDTWIKRKDWSICDWKVYGLFWDLGKGINIFFTDEIEKSATPQTIFKPINL